MIVAVAEVMAQVRDAVKFKAPVTLIEILDQVARSFDVTRADLYHAYANEVQTNPEIWALHRQVPMATLGGRASAKRQGEGEAMPEPNVVLHQGDRHETNSWPHRSLPSLRFPER